MSEGVGSRRVQRNTITGRAEVRVHCVRVDRIKKLTAFRHAISILTAEHVCW